MPTRRQLLGALVAIPFVRSVAAQPSATPEVVSETFSVTWWEIAESDFGSPVFRANVLNTGDQLVDAPVIGITAYDSDGNIVGSGFATPEPPILAPGERAFLRGTAPEDLPEDVAIELFDCTTPEMMDMYVTDNAGLDLELDLESEEREDEAFRAKGTVMNNGAEPAELISVIALFTNPDGRIVGTLSTQLDRDIPAGKSMRWEIGHGFGRYQSSHPFTELLDPDYEVTYWVGRHPNTRFITC